MSNRTLACTGPTAMEIIGRGVEFWIFSTCPQTSCTSFSTCPKLIFTCPNKQCPGRAIVLPPALAVASALAKC